MLNNLNLNLPIDFIIKQEECSKLVEEYSEEFKMNYSELKQTVEVIQQDLSIVSSLFNA